MIIARRKISLEELEKEIWTWAERDTVREYDKAGLDWMIRDGAFMYTIYKKAYERLRQAIVKGDV